MGQPLSLKGVNMKKQIAVVALALFLAFCLPAIAEDEVVGIDAYIHWVRAYTQRIVEWAAVDGVDGYEIYLERVEDGRTALRGKLLGTNTHTIKFVTPGHWVYYVRWFKMSSSPGGTTKEYGEWGKCTDSTVGVVNGHPRAWVVYVPFIK